MPLVLTRRVGDTISIGEDIVIYIKEIKGKEVRIGIEAGKDTQIYRGNIRKYNKPEAAPLVYQADINKRVYIRRKQSDA